MLLWVRGRFPVLRNGLLFCLPIGTAVLMSVAWLIINIFQLISLVEDSWETCVTATHRLLEINSIQRKQQSESFINRLVRFNMHSVWHWGGGGTVDMWPSSSFVTWVRPLTMLTAAFSHAKHFANSFGLVGRALSLRLFCYLSGRTQLLVWFYTVWLVHDLTWSHLVTLDHTWSPLVSHGVSSYRALTLYFLHRWFKPAPFFFWSSGSSVCRWHPHTRSWSSCRSYLLSGENSLDIGNAWCLQVVQTPPRLNFQNIQYIWLCGIRHRRHAFSIGP